MEEYFVNLNHLEELQVTNATEDLDRIFNRAKSTIVQGMPVVITRSNPDGKSYKIEELTTEEELTAFKQKIFRYL